MERVKLKKPDLDIDADAKVKKPDLEIDAEGKS